jgi:hypothetical protein
MYASGSSGGITDEGMSHEARGRLGWRQLL